MKNNKFLVMLLVAFTSCALLCVGCDTAASDTTATVTIAAKKVSGASLPNSGATRAITTKEDFEAAIANLAGDPALDVLSDQISNNLPSSSKGTTKSVSDSDFARSMFRAITIDTVESGLEEFSTNVEKAFTDFDENGTCNLDESFSYSNVATDIKGITLDNLALSLQAKGTSSETATSFSQSLSASLAGTLNASVNVNDLLVGQSITDTSAIKSIVSNNAFKMICNANMSIKDTDEDETVKGDFLGAYSGSLGFVLGGDVGGKVVMNIDIALSCDADDIESLVEKDSDAITDTVCDFFDTFVVSCTVYNDENEQTYQQKINSLEEYIDLISPAMTK